MKYTRVVLILGCLFLVNCREKVKEEKMIPVEVDGGIGDGAEPLDSMLQYQTPPIISKENRDTLFIKTDSL